MLNALGQDPEVSQLVETQVTVQIYAAFFYCQYDLYKRWLACMRITLAPLIVMVSAMVLHPPLCFLFMYEFDMGIVGLAVATLVKDIVLFLAVTIYGSCSTEIQAALVPINSEAFRGWGSYLRISLPSTAMICSACWAFEVIALLAGNIGVNELASQVICMHIIAMTS